MKGDGASRVASLAQRLLPRLRYPQVFLLLAALLLVDLVVPDPIPLVDEMVLAALTFLVASWRRRREPQQQAGDLDRGAGSPHDRA